MIGKEGYRAELEYKRDTTQQELDFLSNEIFERDAVPTEEEWGEMDSLRARIAGYNELLNHFFQPEPIVSLEVEGWLY